MGHKRDLDRFHKYVSKTEGCWLWNGAAIPRGYGRFYLRGKARYAHRASLELHGFGIVPDDKVVMHSCDNPACVNPLHLKVGTSSENMQDASRKGRVVRVQDWHGIKNPKSKLRVGDRMNLEREILLGIDLNSLAMKYGVTRERIYQIRKEIKKAS